MEKAFHVLRMYLYLKHDLFGNGKYIQCTSGHCIDVNNDCNMSASLANKLTGKVKVKKNLSFIFFIFQVRLRTTFNFKVVSSEIEN
jgi:hypothetical protein